MKTLYLFLLIPLFFFFNSNAQLTADFTAPDTICAGTQTTLTATSNNAQSFLWHFGEDPFNPQFTWGNGNTIDHTFYSPGTYIVTLRVLDNMGKIHDFPKPVYVRPYPEAQFDIDQYSSSGIFCINTLFSISRWSPHTGYDSIQWDFGDGTTSDVKSPTHQYMLPGQFTIKSSVYGKCGSDADSITLVVMDDPAAKPDVNLSAYPNEMCLGEEVNIQVYSQSTLDSITVNTGDGKQTSLDDFIYLYKQYGSYTLEAIAYNKCGSDTMTKMVNVLDVRDIQPSIYPQPQNPCVGTPVRFSVSRYMLAGGEIDFGDGTQMSFNDTTPEISHIYSNMGTYTVKVIYHYTNCIVSDTVQTQVAIASGTRPYRPYFSTYPTHSCLGEEFTVNLPSVQLGDTLDLYYDDGNHQRFIDTRPYNLKYKYGMPGFYSLKAVYTNSCGFKDSSIASHIVKTDITTPLYVSSSIDRLGSKSCINDTTFFWAGASGNQLSNFLWTFQDGTTDTGSMVKRVFTKPGDYSVMVKAKNICNVEVKSGTTVEITNKMVNPHLGFYYYPLTNCVNNEFMFDVFHSGATKLNFDFGDGTTLDWNPWMPHIFKTYGAPGIYTVNITASNSCGENIRQAYPRVIPGPIVEFSYEDKTYRVDENVTFTNNSTDFIDAYWIFNRDYEDTTNAETPVRSYDQPGTYDVTLLLLNEYGCYDTLTKQVRVGDGSLVNKLGEGTITFYPNPTTGKLTILPSTPTKNASLKVIDLNGRAVLTKAINDGEVKTEIDLEYLPGGMYFLNLNTNDSQYTGRIILTN